MREVVIASYLRTAQSRSRPNDPARDWFHKLRSDELLAQLLPEVIKRAGIEPKEVDDFLVGSATGVNEQWSYGGRFPIFLADLPETISAKFLDQQCGSAMAALHMGFMEVAMGYADTVMIGGMEHMTRIPMGGPTTEKGWISPSMALFTDPKLAHWDMPTTMTMGLTAEKLVDQCGCTREEMDAWAVRSHHRAAQGQQDGYYDDEILPVEAEQADGTVMTVTQDQAVRGDTTLEGLSTLKTIFRPEGGRVTAGTSSPLNAGATSMIMMSKDKARAQGVKPLATVRSIGFAGVDPTIMGHGPVPASKKALAAAGLDVKDIDFWEINEAFVVVVLNCIKELGIDPEKVNVMGGGTAIGHPLGATGVRLTGTLARILNLKGGRYGLANACCGGGQGVATIIEREDYDW
ncbi:MAG: acetyl-CoA C-acetyltransferase [Proteobacteria bacterium]|nr:acetyl-CoA C-acetyltransferase [Pseudomonadota bacterium]